MRFQIQKWHFSEKKAFLKPLYQFLRESQNSFCPRNLTRLELFLRENSWVCEQLTQLLGDSNGRNLYRK